jgi:hypothetical protein
MYIMTSDNIPDQRINDPFHNTCYAGLSGFSSGSGGYLRTWEGGSLVAAAAFYYDDPQYRWFVRHRNLYLGSEGGYHFPMHSAYDTVGSGRAARAIPGRPRCRSTPSGFYGVLSNPHAPAAMSGGCAARRTCRTRRPTAFRSGTDSSRRTPTCIWPPVDMYLEYPTQDNSIARYTDLGDIWLYANTYDGSTWSRSVVNCSDRRELRPRAACQIEALANLAR